MPIAEPMSQELVYQVLYDALALADSTLQISPDSERT